VEPSLVFPKNFLCEIRKSIFFVWLNYLIGEYLSLDGQAIGLSVCHELVLLVRLSLRLIFVFPTKSWIRTVERLGRRLLRRSPTKNCFPFPIPNHFDFNGCIGMEPSNSPLHKTTVYPPIIWRQSHASIPVPSSDLRPKTRAPETISASTIDHHHLCPLAPWHHQPTPKTPIRYRYR
jgi:hypothetical protein